MKKIILTIICLFIFINICFAGTEYITPVTRNYEIKKIFNKLLYEHYDGANTRPVILIYSPAQFKLDSSSIILDTSGVSTSANIQALQDALSDSNNLIYQLQKNIHDTTINIYVVNQNIYDSIILLYNEIIYPDSYTNTSFTFNTFLGLTLADGKLIETNSEFITQKIEYDTYGTVVRKYFTARQKK